MGLKHNALLSHEHVWPSTSYLTVAIASVLSFRVIFIFSCVASKIFSYVCWDCGASWNCISWLQFHHVILRPLSQNDTNRQHIFAYKSCYLVIDAIFTNCWQEARWSWVCWIVGSQMTLYTWRCYGSSAHLICGASASAASSWVAC